MADEKDVKKEVETEKVETEKVEPAKEEPKKEEATETKETEKKEEVSDKVEDAEPTEPEKDTEPQVQEVEEEGNGIRVDDLATKDFVTERFAALEAKINAVVKENMDLKEKLAESQNKANELEDKYVNKDFGGLQRQGVMANANKEMSFEEYSKQFM